MCCIFTCCGWVIDLVQRLWTFTMACCIAIAVCCALILASLSGIAMGYNYSLAEYIDLKETNVSVYLKRGIFDDDIVDDMDWRRSGHLPVKGLINEDNLVTASEMTEASLRSGRRMDDSIFESDDHHRFEGSLMKLTAKPVHQVTDVTQFTPEPQMAEIGKFAPGSLDQMKAVQAIINRRKMDSARYSSNKRDKSTTPLNDFAEQNVVHFPEMSGGVDARRAMNPSMDLFIDPRRNGQEPVMGPGDSARLAVPGPGIGEASKWMNPRLPPNQRVTLYFENAAAATFPAPRTPRPGPLRPSRPPPPRTYPKPTQEAETQPTTTAARNMKEILDDDLESFKERLMLDTPLRSEEFLEKMKGGSRKTDVEDYDDDIKGLPVRKKRRVYGTPYTGINNYIEIHNRTMINNNTTLINYVDINIVNVTSNLSATNNPTNIEKIDVNQTKQITLNITKTIIHGSVNKLKPVNNNWKQEAPRNIPAVENNYKNFRLPFFKQLL